MKDIQEIVKKVANRYSVEYNSSLSGPKIKDKDGNITSLSTTDLEKLFYNQNSNNKTWHQINSVQKASIKKSRMKFQETTIEYNAKDLSVMPY